MKAKFKKVVRSSFPELDNPYLLNFIIIIKYFLTYQYQCYYLNIEWISFLSVHSSPEVYLLYYQTLWRIRNMINFCTSCMGYLWIGCSRITDAAPKISAAHRETSRATSTLRYLASIIASLKAPGPHPTSAVVVRRCHG